MKKLALGIVLSIIVIAVIWGLIPLMNNIPKEIPNISISIGEQDIPYVSGPNVWNRKAYDRKDLFKTILDKSSASEIPYIRLDKIAKVDFGENPPEKIEILDSLINEFGDLRFAEKVSIVSIIPKINGGEYSFELNKTIASALSSDIFSYQPGNTLRGYRLLCSWGKNKCEYAFVIKTDAGMGMILPENQMEVKIAAEIEKYHPTMSSVPGLPLIAAFEEKEGKKYKLQWKVSAGLLLLWDKRTGKIENLENPAFTDNEMVYWSSVRGNSGEFISNKDIVIKLVVLDEDENVLEMAEAVINVDKSGYATIKK